MKNINLYTVAFIVGLFFVSFSGSAFAASASDISFDNNLYFKPSSPKKKKRTHRRHKRSIRKISKVKAVSYVRTNNPNLTGSISSGNQRIDELIVQASTTQNVDPILTYCMMHQESSFKRSARSHKGASGLMQLMPPTARRFGVKNIYDLRENISGGVRYMRWLLSKFNGNTTLALAGYNAGEGAVMKYGYQVPPYRETRNYVKKISGCYAVNSSKRNDFVAKVRQIEPIQPISRSSEDAELSKWISPLPTEAVVEMEISSKVSVIPDSPVVSDTMGAQPISLKKETIAANIVSREITSTEKQEPVNPNTAKKEIARKSTNLKFVLKTTDVNTAKRQKPFELSVAPYGATQRTDFLSANFTPPVLVKQSENLKNKSSTSWLVRTFAIASVRTDKIRRRKIWLSNPAFTLMDYYKNCYKDSSDHQNFSDRGG